MMELFEFRSRFTKCSNCYFRVNYYRNPKNKYLEVYNDNEGCIAILTVNTDEVLNDDEIMIKNYSEGEGNDIFLVNLGIIEDQPCNYVRSGFVVIPIYKLTDKGKNLWIDKGITEN